jgi:hypothetical protein
VLGDEEDRFVRGDALAEECYEKKREECDETDVDPGITSRH